MVGASEISGESQAFQKLSTVITGLKNTDRLKIAMMLLEEKKLSFNEIKRRLGDNYKSSLLAHNLRELVKDEIVKNKKEIDSLGRVKISFYKLSNDGNTYLSKLRDAFY